jgi:hypothetical protein
VEGSRFGFVSDEVTYVYTATPSNRALILVLTTLNDLITIRYFSLLQKGSTNRQSQLDFLLRFYCWLHVSAFVKAIIRQLEIYNRQII